MLSQGIDAGATPQQLAGKVLVEMMRVVASNLTHPAQPVCAKLITLQGCGVALASLDYVPETMSTIVPMQYDINNVVPKYLVEVYDSQSDAGHVQPTGTDFKSTSLKLLEAVSNCKDNDRFDRRSGPDTTATPCADALKAIDADEYAHKVRSILEKEYATHPSDQMNSLLQKAILAETAASMAPMADVSEGSPLEGIFIFFCVLLLGAAMLGGLIFFLKMQGKPTDGFLPVTLPKPNFPSFSVATRSTRPGTPTKADPSENLRSKLQRLREERSTRLFKE